MRARMLRMERRLAHAPASARQPWGRSAPLRLETGAEPVADRPALDEVAQAAYGHHFGGISVDSPIASSGTSFRLAGPVEQDRLGQERTSSRQDDGLGRQEFALPPGMPDEEQVNERGPCEDDVLKRSSAASVRQTLRGQAAPAFGLRKLDGPDGGSGTAADGGSPASTVTDLKVGVGTISYEFDNPSNLAVGAFGQEDFHCSHKDGKAKVDGDQAKVDFTIALHCPWGVNGGGNTDVPSATDAAVTTATHASGKKVYEQIAQDLTPVQADSWRPARTYYWAKPLTERHERFHSTEDEKWGKGPGTTVVTSYLNSKTISATSAVADVSTLLGKAMTQMQNANWEWYSGGGKPYIQRPGEMAAFLEGKDAYTALADGVKTQGAKLEEDEKKAAK